MNKKYIVCIFFLSASLFSCKQGKEKSVLKEKLAKIEVSQKTFDFGNIHIGDTITHVFKIQNKSVNKLYVHKIATSCNCTTIGNIDSIAKKDEVIAIKTRFIAKEELKGKVSNSVIVEMNTKPSFIVLRLKGYVIPKAK